MKVTYDGTVDTLTILLRDAVVVESDEVVPGVVLDFDEQGALTGVEILDASCRVTDPSRVEFEEMPASQPLPRSLGIGDSGHTDIARRTGKERPEPHT